MKVTVDIRPRPDLPGVVGAHELSWSYLLDRVMADAYHHQLGCLRVVLPAATLQEALAARTLPGAEAAGGAAVDGDVPRGADDGLGAGRPPERRTAADVPRPPVPADVRSGLALLAGGLEGVRAADQRLYLLDFGNPVPGGPRRGAQPGTGWALEARLHVFSRRARLLGIPIRLAQALRRPDLADRAMFAMRRAFASERPVPAAYRLSVWARKAGTAPGSGEQPAPGGLPGSGGGRHA